MITEITKAQLLTWRLGVLREMKDAPTAQISMAKKQCRYGNSYVLVKPDKC
jgi:hypothetical protein